MGRDAKSPEAYENIHDILRRGDVVGVAGRPSRTQKGQLSISASEVVLLAPNLHQLPKEYYGLKDLETRYRKRYLDLILNDDVRHIFVTRSKVISYMREYLDNRGFIEVRHKGVSMCLF
jgi:lysyl-tRNA synthetase class 2